MESCDIAIKPNDSCCCGNQPVIKQTASQLTAGDILGAWKVRWGIDRMNYKVDPGLYSLGKPDSTSPVLVTLITK